MKSYIYERRNVPVSGLAAYAADPEYYARNFGKLGTEKQRRDGTRAHDSIGLPQVPALTVMIVLGMIALVIFIVMRLL